MNLSWQDWNGIAGTVLGIVGLWVTWLAYRQAESAREAAIEARDATTRFQRRAHLAERWDSAVAGLDDIRKSVSGALPQVTLLLALRQVSSLRRLLTDTMTTSPILSQQLADRIDAALTQAGNNISDIELQALEPEGRIDLRELLAGIKKLYSSVEVAAAEMRAAQKVEP